MKGRERVAARYAKSLLNLALEKGVLDAVYSDMQCLANTCQTSGEFLNFLQSPIIKTDKKKAILKELFEAKITPLSTIFINIIALKKRESYLPEITTAFISQYQQHKNIVTAVVTSAIGLDSTLRAEVLALVRKTSTAEIELKETINKNLIGGFVLRIGDQQLDASIQRTIKDLSRSFSDNPYVKQ